MSREIGAGHECGRCSDAKPFMGLSRAPDGCSREISDVAGECSACV